jgi:hypothetical protein
MFGARHASTFLDELQRVLWRTAGHDVEQPRDFTRVEYAGRFPTWMESPQM